MECCHTKGSCCDIHIESHIVVPAVLPHQIHYRMAPLKYRALFINVYFGSQYQLKSIFADLENTFSIYFM
jgi:hypothetical protein